MCEFNAIFKFNVFSSISQVIFVLRNPKDLAVSYWHFARPMKWNPRHEKWDTFFDIYCTDESKLRFISSEVYMFSVWPTEEKVTTDNIVDIV